MSEGPFSTSPKITSKKYGSRKDPDKKKRPCIHCNKRRIKCDLMRPSCFKCLAKGLDRYYERPIRIVQKTDRSIGNILKESSLSCLKTTSKAEFAAQIIESKRYSTNADKLASFLENRTLCTVTPANDTAASGKRNQRPLVDRGSGLAISDVYIFSNQELAAVQFSETQPNRKKGFRTSRETFCKYSGNPKKVECEALASCDDFGALDMKTMSQGLATLLAEYVDLKMEEILDLCDYFAEVILDQMVPYDSHHSPYRKFLLAKIQKSTALLTTVASISAGHLYERDLISKKVAASINELSNIFADQSYRHLKEQFESGHDFMNDARLFDNCLNLLLQFSRSIFCCGTSRIARFSNLRGYIAIVNNIFCDLRQKSAFEFEKTDTGQNGFLWFLLQRLIFNDIFLSFLNDSKPLVNNELITSASQFEQMYILKTSNIRFQRNSILSTSMEITGCPMSLLEIMHQIQTKPFMLELLQEEVRASSDKSREILVVRERAAYGKYYLEKSKYVYESCIQNLISSKCMEDDEVPGYVSLIKIFFNATNILNLKYIMKDTPSSIQMINNVHELLEVVSKEIDIGSGPDTCVAFPVFIAAREAHLQSHRDAVLNFMDLSCWHLNLGGQKMAKELLCSFY